MAKSGAGTFISTVIAVEASEQHVTITMSAHRTRCHGVVPVCRWFVVQVGRYTNLAVISAVYRRTATGGRDNLSLADVPALDQKHVLKAAKAAARPPKRQFVKTVVGF
jgi:hypothetical protein